MLIIFIVLVVLCVIGAVLYYIGDDKDSDGIKYTGGCMFWISFVAFCLLGLPWLSTYPSSVGTVSELVAFQDGVYETYVSAVDMTEKATIKLNMDKAMFSAENMKQSSNISDRIKELRDKVAWYNETLTKYRIKKKIWWMDPFYVEVPENLKPIKLVLLEK